MRDTIIIIDEHGFFRGTAPNTQKVRDTLGAKGYDVTTDGLASKQWIKAKKELDRGG